MDRIIIKDLQVFCNHGVYKEETVLGQKFLVSASLYLDTRKAGKTDDLSSSVNYADVCRFIEQFMKENTYMLIEAAAENLAQKILLHYPLIKKILLEIKKPWAPILLPLETVSVVIERQWNTAYLGIGSNMGNKEENLKKAIDLLKDNVRIKVVKISDFLVTAPVSDVIQEDFLNGALQIETLLDPQELLTVIGEIEQKLKRVRTVRWGPRTIDLDILLYEDQIIQDLNLTIPHCQMHKRAFVLDPLCEIAPYAFHPVLHKTAMELKESMD